jgi:hypothetical protein
MTTTFPSRPAHGARAHTGHRIGAWHGRAKHSAQTVRQARELRAKGLTHVAIGNALGVPSRTVADWLSMATRWGD